ncbi:sugar ABC transporter permease [Cellulomonas humilata]|uniref:Sugar ABC transporter permease n=1 Tax=Cellulomonas humilata TaxID=144055 RepID=A0A7Y6A0D8_9CELL|nr:MULTISPECIES: sugar ABC transporter permease [Cellulomonas]KQY46874.1 ABC transporter permease [Cellulomonas sp. Root137]KRD44015.1 ABC transporter permease [Cellulomonas sp. Root930]NUU16605.1 sugar ABC transporter permease [Cellulomonas humilata]
MSVVTELRRTARSARGEKGTPSRRSLRNGDGKAAALFLLPWFLGLGLITIGPMVASGYLSFTDYDLLQPPTWIGLENYTRLFEDPRLANSLRVTFTYVFTAVPLQLAAALGLALMLDRGLKGLPFYRSVLYLPSLLGGSVAVAILWRQVFGIDGLVNQFLALFGIQGKGWVSDPETALWTLVLLHIWTFGAPMIIFLAGLRQIPEMYYEAAAIDGAGAVRRFRSITLPLLTPIIFFNLVLQVIGAFQSFTQAFVVSGGTGGPADSTMFYTLYLYQKGFTAFDMGYASAMAWLLVLIVAAMTLINFFASKFWVFYDD